MTVPDPFRRPPAIEDPVPVRIARRITRPHEVIEEVVEFATPTPAPSEERVLPRGDDRRCDCALCESGLRLTHSGPARQAVAPAPAPRRWWR